MFKDMEESVRLMAAEKAKQESIAEGKHSKKNALTVTMDTVRRICTLATSLEQVKKEVGELKKEIEAAIKELSKMPEGQERAEHEQNELQVKQQRA